MKTPTNLYTNLQKTTPDGLGFFEAVALAGLENEWFTLTYDMQRYFFQQVPFGKKRVRVKDNTIELIKKLAFGQDWDITNLVWNQAKKEFIPYLNI